MAEWVGIRRSRRGRSKSVIPTKDKIQISHAAPSKKESVTGATITKGSTKRTAGGGARKSSKPTKSEKAAMTAAAGLRRAQQAKGGRKSKRSRVERVTTVMQEEEDVQTSTMGTTLDKEMTDPRNRVEACIKRKRQEFQKQQEQLPDLKKSRKELLQHRQTCTSPWHLHRKRKLDEELRQLDGQIARIQTRVDVQKFNKDATRVLAALSDVDRPSLPQVPVFISARVATKADGVSRRRQTPQPVCFTVRQRPDSNAPATTEQPPPLKRPAPDGAVEPKASEGTAEPVDHTGGSAAETTSSPQLAFREVVADGFLDEYDPEREREWIYSLSEDACERCGSALCHDSVKDVYVCENPECRMEKQCVSGVSATLSNSLIKGDRYRRAAYFRCGLQKLQGIFKTADVTPEAILKIKFHLLKVMKVKWVHSSAVQTALEQMDKAYPNDSPKPEFYKKMLPAKNYITKEITGVSPPTLTPAQNTEMDRFFAKVSAAFDELRARAIIKKRKNMISYNLCTFKGFELKPWGQKFLVHFRSSCWPEKTARQDHIWSAICEYCDFDYIKTG
jgi:hypothetical protein